ncbi:MAG TPA: OB-fold nucleic acid binding domain-containing protein [Verrucomicrobiae bacterium]|jgi:hypothetical protein|nr:OB-fold nucleic acid binding domain-containing protein [Verrucomicrobiae bacterium]
MISKAQIKKAGTPAFIVLALIGGFFLHMTYQRWTAAPQPVVGSGSAVAASPTAMPKQSDDPTLIAAKDVDKIRLLAGGQATIRGRVYRVGKSSRSNTYFINFGPSRASLTAVIFPSVVERFEQSRLAPKSFEGKEIEVSGEVKDHPQYGLEIILEDPGQVKIIAD